MSAGDDDSSTFEPALDATLAATQNADANTPGTFGPYQVDGQLGAGGMGVVFSARDEAGQIVPIKRLHQDLADDKARERFVREARILETLEHPALVRHIDHGRTIEGDPYLVMEWLEGEDLAQRKNAPRWVFVDGGSGEVTTALDEITPRLRGLLPEAEDLELDRSAIEIMEGLLSQLQAHAPALLPRRKQRALEQMRHVLERYSKQAKKIRDGERLQVVQDLLYMTDSDDRVDFDQLVESWLVLVRPRWRHALHEHKRRRSLRRLSGLSKELIADPLPTDQLLQLSHSVRLAKPLAERVVAAIIGTPTDQGSLPS